MALGLAQLRQRQPTEWTRWKAIERPLWARRADETRAAHAPLARYLEGWAQADPAKIIAAVAPGYRFHDPLIGAFTQHSLPRYFDDLQARCARAGAILRQDLAFLLCGPMDERADGGRACVLEGSASRRIDRHRANQIRRSRRDRRRRGLRPQPRIRPAAAGRCRPARRVPISRRLARPGSRG